jgi:hypothetical protein
MSQDFFIYYSAISKAIFIILVNAFCRSSEVVSSWVARLSDTVSKHAAFFPRIFALWKRGRARNVQCSNGRNVNNKRLAEKPSAGLLLNELSK